MKKKSTAIVFYNKKSFLILKKNKNNLWELPGGKKRKTESFYSAALRESEEELGFLPKFKKTGFISLTNKTNKLLLYFFKVHEKFRCVLSKEHIDYQWVNLLHQQKLQLSAKAKKILKYLENKI